MIFSIISQIGGFCYFIKLIFSSLINLFVENVQSADFINSVKMQREEALAKIKIEEFSNSKENDYNLNEDFKKGKL